MLTSDDEKSYVCGVIVRLCVRACVRFRILTEIFRSDRLRANLKSNKFRPSYQLGKGRL